MRRIRLDGDDRTGTQMIERGQQLRNQRRQFGETIRLCPQDEERERKSGDSLLECEASVDRNDGVETFVGSALDEISVRRTRPTHVADRPNFVPDDEAGEPFGYAFIKQQACHAAPRLPGPPL